MDLRSTAAQYDQLLADRLDTIVPALLDRTGIDCWLIIAREYNEDPAVRTMLPASWMAARRLTVLAFFPGERLSIGRYAIDDLFPAGWDPDAEPDQWKAIAAVVADRNPQRIAVNTSQSFSHADGLAHTDYVRLMEALGPDLGSRVESSEPLAVGWLETRSSAEMELYPGIVAASHEFLRRALSPEVIRPGATTTDDVVWWLRQAVADAGYGSWFQPTVSLQREAGTVGSFAQRPEADVIVAGDLVHIDFGITHLGLHTDMQQHAYVLPEGESSAPAGLAAGLAVANRLQDILMSEFIVGRTGNEILAQALSVAESEGIAATVYTHPIGLHGHAAGPTIGMWDQQGGVPGAGDYPLFSKTAYSIELNAAVSVPEWNDQTVKFMLEEDAYFDGAMTFLHGRQTELWLV